MEEMIKDLIIHNGNKNDFLNKNNNIWLGVSTSLKPYSEKLSKDYLKLIVKYSRESALIFIADEIAAINYNVLEKYGKETSLKKSLQKGDIFLRRYKKLIKTLPKEEQSKIKLIRWKDVWAKRQEESYKILKEEYLTNPKFKKEIEAPIILYLKNSKRTIKESRVIKMSEYILKELPFLLEGVEFQNKKYNLMLYPAYGKTSLSKLVSNIQKGNEFQKIKKKLKLKGAHILADSQIIE